MKIAQSGPLTVKLDYDTGENYSLSSTFSRWSDVRAPLLVSLQMEGEVRVYVHNAREHSNVCLHYAS